MLKFLKRNILVIVLLVISLIVYNRWFFNLGILSDGDWVFFPKETMAALRIYYFSLWLGDNFGRVLYDVGQAPTWAMYGFLAKFLNVGYALGERLIHFWPVAILTPLCSYLLLRKLFSKKIAVFVGVLVYSFNTYFLILQTGTLTLMAAFSFAPIILWGFIKTLETIKLKYAVLTGLLLFIAGAYEPRAVYIIVWVLFLYFLYFYIYVSTVKKIKQKIEICIRGFLPILIVGLLNLYWIIGLSKIMSFGAGTPLGRSLFGGEFYNILYSLTLFHPFWTGKKLVFFTVQPIPFYFWLIPIFAFSGLVLYRKNKSVLFFGVITLLGIFLSKQVGAPFKDVYLWLYIHVPGFNAFREASKFYFLIALGYSVLVAAFIEWLWTNWNKKKLYVYLKYLFTMMIIVIFLWNTKSLITGEIKTLFVSRQVSSDYALLGDFTTKQSDYFRISGVPGGSKYIVSSENHPMVYWELFYYVNENNPREKVKNGQLTPGQMIVSLMNKSYSNNLLNIESVKYIIIPLLDTINDDNLFINQGEKRNYYLKELNKIPYLRQINIGTKDLVVYENYTYKPHIYLTSEKETIYRDVRAQTQDIRSKFVNPTEYKISLKNIKGPTYLNFSEVYHPDWKIRVGDFNWLDVLVKKNYFLSDKNHFQNDATLNSYLINPETVCNVQSCKVNSDGSYDIDMTLYFAPEAYFNLGLIVSGGTLILILGYLTWIGGRYILYERKNK
jgi:hypothetical protein